MEECITKSLTETLYLCGYKGASVTSAYKVASWETGQFKQFQPLSHTHTHTHTHTPMNTHAYVQSNPKCTRKQSGFNEFLCSKAPPEFPLVYKGQKGDEMWIILSLVKKKKKKWSQWSLKHLWIQIQEINSHCDKSCTCKNSPNFWVKKKKKTYNRIVWKKPSFFQYALFKTCK